MRPVADNLKKYLHRINPRVEMGVEFLVTLAEDSINTKSDWEAATQTPANSFFDPPPAPPAVGGAPVLGTVSLKASNVLGIQSIVSTSFIENLSPNLPSNNCQRANDPITCISPEHYAAFELGDNYGPAARLIQFKAHISRQRVGGNPQFNGAFRLDLFTLAYYGPGEEIFQRRGSRFSGRRDVGQLVPVGDPVFVNASQTVSTAVDDRWPLWPLGATDTGLVTFDLSDQFVIAGELPIPQLRGHLADLNGRQYVRRIILARIQAVRGTTGATNVGWSLDPTVDVVIRAGGFGTLRQVQLSDAVRLQDLGRELIGRLKEPPFYIKVPTTEFGAQFRGVPRCEFTMAEYPTGTPDIEKQVDLGSVPASAATVEFGAIFHKPLGTTINPQVSTDGIVPFVTYVDGQTASDLGLAAQQTYFLRFQMAANTNRDTSPTGVELTVRDRTKQDVTDLVRLSAGNFAVDPRTMRGEIRQVICDVIRDGVRDFKDRASRLAYEQHPNALDIALYVRASKTPLPPRDEWTLLDVFRVTDQESLWGAERFTAISVLEKLKKTIPRQKETAPSSGVFIRAPIVFADSTIENVWTSLLTEAQVPARYIGQPPVGNLEDPKPTGTDSVSFPPSLTKTILKVRDCKREIDRLGLIHGGVTTTAHGRIVFRRLLGEKGMAQFFRYDDITLGPTPRNLPERMIEFIVPFNFDFQNDRFNAEVRSFDGDALTNLGVPTVGRRPSELDEEAAQYLPDAAHGRAIGAAVITAFGGGVLFPWEFSSVIPHPELEVGDLIAFETDRLTVRDPINNREIKGRSFVKAVVAGSNLLGTRFTVWVRSFSDIINVGGDIGDFGEIALVPEILSTTVTELINNTVKRCVDTDADTLEVVVFRRRGTVAGNVDWPTVDGTQTGVVDKKYGRGTIGAGKSPHTVGNTFCYQDGFYAVSDIIRDIFVPIGFQNQEGARLEEAYTVLGTGSPAFLTTNRVETQPGTACSPTTSRRQVTLNWTTINATDANQDVEILSRLAPASSEFVVVGLVTDPVATTSFEHTAPVFNTNFGTTYSLDYQLKLKTGAVVEDQAQLDDPTFPIGSSCFF